MTATTSVPEITRTPIDPDHINALFRLAMMSESHPELANRERGARLRLAAAIMAMDGAEGQPGRHNLHEQAEVNRLMQEHAQALADLVRGERSDS